ncbi:MAG: beta-propeller domain-containing protein [Candidatus Bathyarchaeia archaeon]
MQKEIQKKTRVYGVVAVLLAITLGAVCYNFGSQFGPIRFPVGQTPLMRFSSHEELKTFLNRSRHYGIYWTGGVWPERSGTFFGTLKVVPSGTAGTIVPGYSTTNIQVEGVDEADIVKTDGQYIYVVSGQSIAILRAYPPEEAELLSQIKLNGSLRGIFIKGDKLAVLGTEFIVNSTERTDPFYFYGAYRTFVRVYDVINRSRPVLKRDLSVDGNYFNSRMIGDYVYVIITQPAYLHDDYVILPRIYSEDGIKEIRASDVYYSNTTDYYYKYTMIAAVNIQEDEQEPTCQTILVGATSCIYVSLGNIYLTFIDMVEGAIGTRIYRLHIDGSEISHEAMGGVPGHVLNQFSMDEYEGYFRIATTTREATSRNHVYILNMSLGIVGKLEDLAPGESIYSARFMGERCYLVTFKKVDPLFVIDLSSPDNPKVLGKLKIPGYSDYLHPYDEDHLIGIGKETVEAEEGDFAWYQGVKISLFDVSDVEKPKETAKYEIGDRGTDSPVLRDHKAFLFDRSKSLLMIPVLVAEIDDEKYPDGVPPYTSGDYVWQGAYVFDISLDGGLVPKGRITHMEDEDDLLKSGYYFSSPYSVKRALYIGNVLYTISDKMVKMNSLETLAEINKVELPNARE